MAARFGGTVLEDERGFRFRSGLTSGFTSGVLRTSVAPGDLAALIADAQAWFPPGIAWRWMSSPLDRPPDLAARLAEAGFSLVRVLPAMTLDLAGLVPRPPAGVEVTEVRDAADLAGWLAVRDANHPLDAAARAAWLRTRPPKPDPVLRQFIARSPDGSPIGSITIFLDGATAGIYHVDVVPPARGRGVGTAMSSAALAAAREAGAERAVLTATELGAALYRPLGFHACGGVRVMTAGG